MTRYYMTVKSSSHGYWEPCRARTLTAAKRECTRRYGAGYIDDTLCVGEAVAWDDRGAPDIQVVAQRSNRAGNKW